MTILCGNLIPTTVIFEFYRDTRILLRTCPIRFPVFERIIKTERFMNCTELTIWIYEKQSNPIP
ncbi:hypothetical protein LEP1GSC039_3719 [Leptospira santarosai str. 2000027870]|nr:hypothetical protein LEP1GSC039_3719 [Leptospira santarosai str. 2000027870]